jgi:phosphohistidine phosphatase
LNRAPPDTRTLYLLRHAKSSWKDETLADRERPLAGRGRKAAKRMAELMRAEDIAPALVLCSPSRRTRETLQRVRPGLGEEASVELDEALYGAGPEDLLARLRRVPPDVPSVMLIGHNPGLEQLALSLARSGERLDDLREKYPTGALATLTFRGTWEDLGAGTAELAGLVKPRELKP